jgi:tetratricopeptide (TPR) repeat protein
VRSGTAAFVAGQLDEAVDIFSAGLQLNSRHAVLYNNRSACYLEKRMPTYALRDADECISIAPMFYKGWLRKAKALYELQDLKRSLDAVKQGIRLEPTSPELLNTMETILNAIQKKKSGDTAYAKEATSDQNKQQQDTDMFMKEQSEEMQEQQTQDERWMAQVRVDRTGEVNHRSTESETISSVMNSVHVLSSIPKDMETSQIPDSAERWTTQHIGDDDLITLLEQHDRQIQKGYAAHQDENLNISITDPAQQGLQANASQPHPDRPNSPNNNPILYDTKVLQKKIRELWTDTSLFKDEIENLKELHEQWLQDTGKCSNHYNSGLSILLEERTNLYPAPEILPEVSQIQPLGIDFFQIGAHDLYAAAAADARLTQVSALLQKPAEETLHGTAEKWMPLPLPQPEGAVESPVHSQNATCSDEQLSSWNTMTNIMQEGRRTLEAFQPPSYQPFRHPLVHPMPAPGVVQWPPHPDIQLMPHQEVQEKGSGKYESGEREGGSIWLDFQAGRKLTEIKRSTCLCICVSVSSCKSVSISVCSCFPCVCFDVGHKHLLFKIFFFITTFRHHFLILSLSACPVFIGSLPDNNNMTAGSENCTETIPTHFGDFQKTSSLLDKAANLARLRFIVEDCVLESSESQLDLELLDVPDEAQMCFSLPDIERTTFYHMEFTIDVDDVLHLRNEFNQLTKDFGNSGSEKADDNVTYLPHTREIDEKSWTSVETLPSQQNGMKTPETNTEDGPLLELLEGVRKNIMGTKEQVSLQKSELSNVVSLQQVCAGKEEVVRVRALQETQDDLRARELQRRNEIEAKKARFKSSLKMVQQRLQDLQRGGERNGARVGEAATNGVNERKSSEYERETPGAPITCGDIFVTATVGFGEFGVEF